MQIEESLSKLLIKLENSSLQTPVTTLYVGQVEAKFRNARYSLYQLKELERPAVLVRGTESSEPLDIPEKINFYCDCIWDFLRSSIDILAQLINELTSGNWNEREVDIKKVAENLDGTLYPQLKISVDNLLRSSAFITLEDYRHCSIHRRQVYVETTEQDVRIFGTKGYDASTSETKQTTYVSHICCNPWDIIPSVDHTKTVVQFCEELLKKIEKRMVTVINRLPS